MKRLVLLVLLVPVLAACGIESNATPQARIPRGPSLREQAEAACPPSDYPGCVSAFVREAARGPEGYLCVLPDGTWSIEHTGGVGDYPAVGRPCGADRQGTIEAVFNVELRGPVSPPQDQVPEASAAPSLP